MGIGKSSSPPPAPDPARAAAVQGAANKDAAIASQELNMIDQRTPYGSLTYQQIRGGSNPRYRAVQTLSAPEQQKLDLQNRAEIAYGETANQLLDRTRGSLAQPFGYDGLPAQAEYSEDTRTAARDRIMARMRPDMDRQQGALETRLANQGIEMGSEAHRRAMDQFQRGQNDMLMAADVQAGQEAAADFSRQANMRDRAINELAMERGQAINEVAALLSGNQIRGPQFVSTPQTQIAPVDTIGPTYASYNAQMNAANQANANQGAMMGGLFGAASNIAPLFF